MTAPADTPVAIVSGGSRGLGSVLVERLLKRGWRVATFSRSAGEFVERTEAAAGESFWWQAADLGQPDTLRGFVADVLGRFGRVDLLVNNAGVLHQELFVTTPPAAIERLITANLVAPVTLAHACARAMCRQRGGVIVNVSSINAIRGFRGVAVYSAAKAGLDGFGRSLARELGPLNIRVNSVVPGFFDTEMTAEVTEENRKRIQRRTPLGRLAGIDEMADAAMFLCSEEASFITGQTIVVDGGITC
ncbi:3-oxoacyl-[acyl-carrier protein] reductase [Herbihabitans rhizosphaerae]|uniref:3-oxoacyl-[acyl-carrier protein] reductase n=1 Tax=Herbihabitans rhizosphaerae TaxID=1872711 RepID=A0A4Q7L553_9PSEU|nr:SDR family oxidoreductase [Herbihabitans rhizosphaerae]RZS44445.1 3-oxoacyl-[acyl-carrier protein] reductase [Herbihabitans rhizosphaerae]